MNPFRRPLIAGNWKMNAGGRDACALARGVADRTATADRVDVVVAPPFTAIAAVACEIEDARGSVDVAEGHGVGVSSQDLHHAASGAFTGEISTSMLRDAGATWAIIGHSERRQMFGETDDSVAQKTKAALDDSLSPIVCVGETLAEREAGETLAVVERQVRAFMSLFAASPGVGVIAYEPVWAIGTGKVASPDDAQAVHARIRELLCEVSEEVAEATRILYGGSMKGDNAAGLLEQADIDGGLVGGASLDAEGFGKIVDAAQVIALKLAEEVDAEARADEAEVEAEGTGESDTGASDEEGQAAPDADSLGEAGDSAADAAEPEAIPEAPAEPVDPEKAAAQAGEDEDAADDEGEEEPTPAPANDET